MDTELIGKVLGNRYEIIEKIVEVEKIVYSSEISEAGLYTVYQIQQEKTGGKSIEDYEIFEENNYAPLNMDSYSTETDEYADYSGKTIIEFLSTFSSSFEAFS